MKFNENDSIRYLMKEMDPSEELLFEQRMVEDEDLLIEVESMRNVVVRLSGLPEVDPPRHISRNVLLQASSHLHYKKQSRTRRTLYLSVAATALIAFMGGSLFFAGYYTSESSHTGEGTNLPAHAETALPLHDLQPESETQTTTTDHRNVDPWVDNNQELRFLDRTSQTETYDSLLYRSFQRLQPIQEPSGSQQSGRNGLHLTGQGQ